MNSRKRFITENPFLVGIFIGVMAFCTSTILSVVIWTLVSMGSSA
jgi:hypothetical protein